MTHVCVTVSWQKPTDKRVFLIAHLLKTGTFDVEELHKITMIDKWFLYGSSPLKQSLRPVTT